MLAFVFCLVVAVPAMAQELAKKQLEENKKVPAVVKERLESAPGELKRFKSCVGNETYCKAITNGKACPEEGPSEEWCFLGEAPLAK